MKGTEQEHASTQETRDAGISEGRWRRPVFRVVAVLLAGWLLLAGVFGLVEPVLMWLPDRVVGDIVGEELPDLPELRSHFMAVGILAWSLVLPALTQLRRPERSTASMLLLVVLAVASLVVFGLTGTFGEWVLEEWTWVVPVLVLAALHPRARDMLSMPAHEPRQLALAGVAALPWAWYAATAVVRQVTGPDAGAEEEYWGVATLLGVIVVAASVIGSADRPGWRLPAGIAAVASALFGLHCLVFPGLLTGLAVPWAVGAVLWGAAYGTASVARARRS